MTDARLAPFYRHGKPVPLTLNDYCKRANMTRGAAATIISELLYRKKVFRTGKPNGSTPAIYEIRQC